jgi:hypothetical protein
MLLESSTTYFIIDLLQNHGINLVAPIAICDNITSIIETKQLWLELLPKKRLRGFSIDD